MRYFIIVAILLGVLTTPAFSRPADPSGNSMAIDEYAAHQAVRLMEDSVKCILERVNSLYLDCRESLEFESGAGLARGYTDAMVAAGASGYSWDHYHAYTRMERQTLMIDANAQAIIDTCDQLLSPVPNNWLLTTQELDIVIGIRNEALKIGAKTNNIRNILWVSYPDRNYNFIVSELDDVKAIQKKLMDQVLWLAAPGNLNVPL